MAYNPQQSIFKLSCQSVIRLIHTVCAIAFPLQHLIDGLCTHESPNYRIQKIHVT